MPLGFSPHFRPIPVFQQASRNFLRSIKAAPHTATTSIISGRQRTDSALTTHLYLYYTPPTGKLHELTRCCLSAEPYLCIKKTRFSLFPLRCSFMNRPLLRSPLEFSYFPHTSHTRSPDRKLQSPSIVFFNPPPTKFKNSIEILSNLPYDDG